MREGRREKQNTRGKSKNTVLHTGIGILDSSFPMQFFITLHKFKLMLGFSVIHFLRLLSGALGKELSTLSAVDFDTRIFS